MRQRTVNFAAKRFADMMYVTGLDRGTAERHFRWRALGIPGGLTARPDASGGQAELIAAHRAGRLTIETNDADRRATVQLERSGVRRAAHRVGDRAPRLWRHPARLARRAVVRSRADRAPAPIRPRLAARRCRRASAAAVRELAAALDALFANSPGIYGILIASPDRVLAERYSAFGAPDRATPSWSMTKAITCTLIGRLIHEGWLGSVYDPAPAPLWRDPRVDPSPDHARSSAAHALGPRLSRASMRTATRRSASRTARSIRTPPMRSTRRSARSSPPCPASVYRYINAGINVLGAIIRDRIESRGLPYHATLYGLLADRLGMGTYQHSADCTGNFIGSGSGFATLRDYAKLGVLYLQDGMWDGERLLPRGWADYALAPTHAGSSYAACFRSNADRSFPDLPPDTAWASGASDQRIFILRRHRLVVSVANETDHPMDLAALNRVDRHRPGRWHEGTLHALDPQHRP